MDFSQVVVLTLMVIATSGHRRYMDLVPNGHNVLNPCDGTPWLGLGHTNPQGGGPRSKFGEDFAAAGHTWTVALCQTDSDGDGKTNGFELGDHNCTWHEGDGTGDLMPVQGHPGICEPLNLCPDSWFTCLPVATGAPDPIGK
ncbi:hypothetical protein BaRGS_00017208 [Batillaria attramentaria]|uniref:Temptin Cys/Cys disulfide domain-containing protein n=1 Tax=Batillaria attramentaria TaxID=370345 RepID=A0ABD0KWR2_9CAEN